MAKERLAELVEKTCARIVLVSFNGEGFVSPDEMTAMLKEKGEVEILETGYNAFRGSRNLKNRPIHTREYLYLVDKG